MVSAELLPAPLLQDDSVDEKSTKARTSERTRSLACEVHTLRLQLVPHTAHADEGQRALPGLASSRAGS